MKLIGSDLLNYQTKITNYFLKNSKDVLLLYMKVGTGKTLTSLNCAIQAIFTKKFNKIIVLAPKGVFDEFNENLNLLASFQKLNIQEIKKLITYIPYNANNAQTEFNKIRNLENTIFIIDEAHLFMKSIIKVRLTPGDKIGNIGNAEHIFNSISRVKNKKILLLTGTPCAKFAFELVPMFNLAGCNFPVSVDKFNNNYVDSSIQKVKNEQDFLKRIDGLVAYVNKDNDQHLKSTDLTVVEVPMTVNQYKQYLLDYASEVNEKGFSTNVNKYGFHFGKISTFHAKTFADSIAVKNESPKIEKIYSDCEKINGLCCVFFKFVQIGCNTFEKYLIKHGYSRLNVSKLNKGKHYIMFTGSESDSLRNKCKKLFNHKDNSHGEYCKYIIISLAGSVGITLKNVKLLAIGSVDFNYSTILQIMGRVNRYNSHQDLPINERVLKNYIYISVKNDSYYSSHKQEIDLLCSRKTYKFEHEPALCIERIIYQDSIYDNIILDQFRSLLCKSSVI